MSESPVKELCDVKLLDCIANAESLAMSSKLGYQKTCRSFYMHACPDWQTTQNPLLKSILNFETSKNAILESQNALRTKHAWVKTVRNIFHHALKCEEAKDNADFQLVKSKWEELNKEISIEVDKVAKTSQLSVREADSWCPHSEWLSTEQRLRQSEFGSANHLLIGFSGGCGFPPLRGGDLGLVTVVSSRDRGADEKYKDGGNVLIWNGLDKESFLLVRNHKTTKTHGTLKRPIPQSLKEIINESFRQNPRKVLFTSPKTNEQFETEESFTRWAQRAFKKIFDGKAVTMNTARHSFISALDTHQMSTQDLEDVATLMGQSVGEQRKYFRLSPKRLREKRIGINLNEVGEYEIPMLESSPRRIHSSHSPQIHNNNHGHSGTSTSLSNSSSNSSHSHTRQIHSHRQRQSKPESKQEAVETNVFRDETPSLSLKNASPPRPQHLRGRRVIRIS